MASRIVTQADHGKTIEVKKGDSIAIHLPENPTTGFRWSLDHQDPTVLEPIEGPFESISPAIGGGGNRTFTFLASTPGQSSIELNLKRPWEGNKPAQKNFRVDFQIHE
jgi:inhibitor of cysteine peptidase